MKGGQLKEAIVGGGVASEPCCKVLVVTVGPAALQKPCTLSQMGK